MSINRNEHEIIYTIFFYAYKFNQMNLFGIEVFIFFLILFALNKTKANQIQVMFMVRNQRELIQI